MRVKIEFVGEPFDRAVVIHTLRHLAMRVGWELSERQGERRIIYATLSKLGDEFDSIEAHSDDVVIAEGREDEIQARGWLSTEGIADAWRVMNLVYETETRANVENGWIKAKDDWWAQRGLTGACAFADEKLNEIARAAVRAGWMGDMSKPRLLGAPFVVVLTHDVDYLPEEGDFGLPRFARAVARQMWLRRKLRDAGRLIWRYGRRRRGNPYWTIGTIREQERALGAHSSFQFVMEGKHRYDPTYRAVEPYIAHAIRGLAEGKWEVCLHGSYEASRTVGQLEREKMALEEITGKHILGHRQHYLNFHPPQLFREVERAGFAYDTSVGYNDATGARAGTFFPYRPYDHSGKRGFGFWEIPFVVMDTTLATTMREDASGALQEAKRALEPVIEAGGCVAIIWHAEQSSGLVDPGYEKVYVDLMEWIRAQGGAMVSGREVLDELNARWRETWAD